MGIGQRAARTAVGREQLLWESARGVCGYPPFSPLKQYCLTMSLSRWENLNDPDPVGTVYISVKVLPKLLYTAPGLKMKSRTTTL